MRHSGTGLSFFLQHSPLPLFCSLRSPSLTRECPLSLCFLLCFPRNQNQALLISFPEFHRTLLEPQWVSHLPPLRWAQDLGWLVTPLPPSHRNWPRNRYVTPSTLSLVLMLGHQGPGAPMKSLPSFFPTGDGFLFFQSRPAGLQLPGSLSSSPVPKEIPMLHSVTSRIHNPWPLQRPAMGTRQCLALLPGCLNLLLVRRCFCV